MPAGERRACVSRSIFCQTRRRERLSLLRDTTAQHRGVWRRMRVVRACVILECGCAEDGGVSAPNGVAAREKLQQRYTHALQPGEQEGLICPITPYMHVWLRWLHATMWQSGFSEPSAASRPPRPPRRAAPSCQRRQSSSSAAGMCTPWSHCRARTAATDAARSPRHRAWMLKGGGVGEL